MTTSSTSRICVWLCGLAAALALALAPTPAAAQSNADKQKAKELYQRGKTQFDLGNFEEAVGLFKEAYGASPHPAFLFNIAQAYRQMGDCKQALFFYKRFLAVSGDDAGNREIVEEQIRELSKTCKANEEIKEKPPLGAMSPNEGDKSGSEVGTGAGQSDAGETRVASRDTSPGSDGEDVESGTAAGITRVAPRRSPSMVAASVEVGPALLSVGGLDIGGAKFSVVAGAGYPLDFGKLGLTVGGKLTLTPVPWNNAGMTGTSLLSSALANVDARYWVLDKVAVRGELGLGALFLSGLSEGNVFLPDMTMSTGALTMFNVRVGVGAEYLINDNLAVSVSPFIYSRSPAKDGLRPEIDGFARIEFLAGIGYRR